MKNLKTARITFDIFIHESFSEAETAALIVSKLDGAMMLTNSIKVEDLPEEPQKEVVVPASLLVATGPLVKPAPFGELKWDSYTCEKRWIKRPVTIAIEGAPGTCRLSLSAIIADALRKQSVPVTEECYKPEKSNSPMPLDVAIKTLHESGGVDYIDVTTRIVDKFPNR